MPIPKLLPPYLLIVGLLVASNIYTLIPLYSILSHEFSTSQSSIAMGTSFFTFSYAAGLLVFGSLVTRFSHRHIILFGMICSALTSILVSTASFTTELLIFRALQGFSLGSFAPVAFALCYACFSHRTLTVIISLINTSFLIAGITGQLWSSFIAYWTNWSFVYISFAVMYTILFFAGFFVLPTIRPMTVTTQPSFFQIVKRTPLVLLYGIVLTLLASIVGYYDALQRSFEGSANELFLIRSIGLLGILPAFFNHLLIEKFGMKRTFYVGLSIGISGFLFSALTENSFTYYYSSITVVAAISILIPTIILLIGSVETKDRTRALSLYSFILLIGASISPIINDVLYFKSSMMLYTLLFVLNFLLLTLGYRTEKVVKV